MADIELVIKLPEELYKAYKGRPPMLGDAGMDMIAQSIAQGTPLPKGHGRLKDTDAICKDIISALSISDEKYLLESEKAVYKRIKNASTIIEADKAERSEEK